MKTNAISLASLSIMITGIILSTASTITIYTAINNATKTIISREYRFKLKSDSFSQIETLKQQAQKTIKENLPNNVNILNDYHYIEAYFPALVKRNEILAYDSNDGQASLGADFIIMRNINFYNNNYPAIDLKNDEVLISTNTTYYKYPKIKIANKEYKVKAIKNIVPSTYAVDTFLIIMPNNESISEILSHYDGNRSFLLNYCYDLKGIEASEYLNFKNTVNVYKIGDLESHYSINKDIYELNGGFVFLGIIVALLFLNGTILILYFKQLAEAYSDRKNYQIMQNVGLDFKTIRKTLNKQITWVIFLPLIIALIHSLVASKIIYQLLVLFGAKSYFDLLIPLLIAVCFFGFCYWCLFKLSSRVYYYFLK